MVEVCEPSMMSSSIPVMVAICGVSQFAGVKVRVDVTVASPVSSEVSVITTLESGWASSTTVNVSVVPDSATPVDPPNSTTVKPAWSLSVVMAATVWSLSASKSSSESASTTEIVMVVPWSPSMMSSSTPVTVTVCAVSQFAAVNVNGLLTDDSEISLELMAITTSEVG